MIEFADLGNRTAVTITHSRLAEEQKRDSGWGGVLGRVADAAGDAGAP